MSAPLTWHVLGAGAMGTLLAASLHAAGISRQLLSHRAGHPVRVCVDGEQTTTIDVQPLDAVPHGSVTHLLLATKAFSVAEALRLCRPCLAPSPVVITCANGLGFEARAAALLGQPLLRAISTEAALREDTERVVHTGRGTTLVGDGSPAAPAWFTRSLGRLPRWHWEPEIAAAVTRKFAINCAINALTALHRCRNGDLVEDPQRRRELEGLCAEIQEILATEGRWDSREPLYELAVDVCRATAANQSSMLQDTLARRATELPYLNGHLLQMAAARGLAAPRNAALCAALERA